MEVSINGLKTHYEVIGEGQPFLILHGWGSNTERWAQVIEPLVKHGYQVIIPDLPGFGLSGMPDMPWNVNNYIKWLEGFTEQLQLKNYYLLGHSFGGALACKMAIKHNQDIKKMFLVAAAFQREKTAQKSASTGIAKVVKIFSFVPFYSLFRKAVYKFILQRSDYAYVQGVMKETYLKVINEDLSFQIPFIKVPTVIIWGEKDDSTPLEGAHYLKQHIKNAVLEIIPGADHDLNRKQPEILVDKVIKNI